MKVREIFDFLNLNFPVETACGFDNPGILTGDPDAYVNGAVIALDCTLPVIDTAVKNGCNLIITHHPVIFEPLKSVLAGSPVYEIIKNGIAVISMHTNLDIGKGGVNDSLCNALGLCDVKKITAADGFILNKVTLSEPVLSGVLAECINTALNTRVKYNLPDKTIKNVLVCSGSGGNYLYEIKKHKCDALITADVKHNIFIDAVNLGVTVFDAGHFETENTVIEPLKNMLETQFKNVKFITDLSSPISYK